MPRYVLLYHECPSQYERPSHWDLMLETEGKLSTWALPQLPNAWTSVRERTAMEFPACAPVSAENAVAAERLPDHRIDYLHEEGPLTGSRGRVRRIAAGAYATVAEQSGMLEVELSGELLLGRVRIQNTTLTRL